MRYRLQQVQALVEGAQAYGLPGLFRVVYRMIGEDQPSVDCIQEAEQGFADAAVPDPNEDMSVGAEQIWDAAVGMASCLRTAPIFEAPGEPEPPEPPEEPEPPPQQPPDLGREAVESVADLVLAALLVHLFDQTKTLLSGKETKARRPGKDGSPPK